MSLKVIVFVMQLINKIIQVPIKEKNFFVCVPSHVLDTADTAVNVTDTVFGVLYFSLC